ncbi:hypothetical protein [Rubrobacter aplysinae]|uniref:hypothetical protein n=1 Tax=Rubrobacter aplysinae TaxID=909625 RepID=UPI00064C11A1|nr:hypothetical protein [Rubrobacter aplysinae]
MEPDPDQHRHLMKHRMEEQRRYIERSRAASRSSSTGNRLLRHLLRGLSRPLSRAFLKLAFALDSQTAWEGLKENLSSPDTASTPVSMTERRPG